MPDVPPSEFLQEILAELEIRPIIHGGGTKSSMGGARIDPQVAAVMRDALDVFFDMEHLLGAVGEGVAKVLGVEAAAIVAGAASGCVLGAAVLRQAVPPDRPAHLLTQRRHYGRYTYLYEQAGCQITEVGTMNDCPLICYEDAIDEDCVGIAWLEGPGIRSAGARLDEVCGLARRHNLPVIVDAAAMAHPFDAIRGFLMAGADLVVVSGGKLLGGPQASGFVLGSTVLTEQIRAIGFPHQGIGRAHKITKEAALGAFVAARQFAASGSDRFNAVSHRAEHMACALNRAGVPARVEQGSRHLIPAVVVFDVRSRLGVSPSIISRRELADPTPVFLPFDEGLDQIYVEFASLDPAHDDLVLRRLITALKSEHTQ